MLTGARRGEVLNARWDQFDLDAAVCDRAAAQGASRVYWLTREDNATAIALYEKVALRTGFIQYRIGLPVG